MEIKTLIEIGSEIRDEIAVFIKNNADYGETIKERERDVTRKVDMAAENALDKALKKRNLSARIISEEIGERVIGDHPDFMLVFDPIDGSANAACGIPFFCTSLAFSEKTDDVNFEDISMAVVCDISGNIYYAVKGVGAFLNNSRISLPKRLLRLKPTVSVYDYYSPEASSGLPAFLKNVTVRKLGSMALEMCFVADGKLDAIIDMRNLASGYDIMASVLILKEAGGVVTGIKGEEISGSVKETSISLIGANSAALHSKIKKVLN